MNLKTKGSSEENKENLKFNKKRIKNRRCPVCNKILPDPPNPFDPFCSDRCKMIDLSKWLNEEYRIHDNNR